MTTTNTSAVAPDARLLETIRELCDTAHIGDHYVAVSEEPDSSGNHLVVVIGYDYARYNLIISTGTALPVQGPCLSAWLDTDVLPDDDHDDYENIILFIMSVVGRL